MFSRWFLDIFNFKIQRENDRHLKAIGCALWKQKTQKITNDGFAIIRVPCRTKSRMSYLGDHITRNVTKF